jgi:hypothetical protein
MKKYLFLGILLITFFESKSQKINWANEEIQAGYKIDNVFTRLDESTQVIGKSERENICEVHQYDTSLNLLKKKFIQFDKKKKYEYQGSIITQNDQTYFILKEFESEEDVHKYYLLKFDEEGEIVMNPTMIFSIPGRKKEVFELKIYYSPDKSKIALVINDIDYSHFSSTSDFNSYIAIYQSDMDLLYKKKYAMPMLASKVENISNWLNNDGTLLYYYKLDKSTNSAFSRSNYYVNKMILINKVGKTIKEIAFEDEPNHFYTTFNITPIDSFFRIGGFFSKNENRNFINGVSIIDLNSFDGNRINDRNINFDSTFYARIYKKNKISQVQEKGMENDYFIVDFITTKEKKTIFVCEKYNVDIEYVSSPIGFGIGGMYTNNTQTFYNFSWGNILTFCIDSNDNVQWTDIYLKRQVLRTKYYVNPYDFYNNKALANIIPVSIFTHQKDNELNIIFNDEKENYDLQMESNNEEKKIKLLSNFNVSQTYNYNINLSNGDEVIENIFNGTLENTIIFPRLSSKISNEKSILFSKKNLNYKIGVINY